MVGETTNSLLCYDSANDVSLSLQDPPIVTILQNQTEIVGFFGRVWKILEQNMNFR